VATYRSVPPSRKAKFCGVPSGAIVKVWCAVGEKRLQNTGLDECAVVNASVLECLGDYCLDRTCS
jgi:hypothetical protein